MVKFIYVCVSKNFKESDMSEDIRRMIRNAFELEGLLMLADERGEEATQLLFDAIREKVESLVADASVLKPIEPVAEGAGHAEPEAEGQPVVADPCEEQQQLPFDENMDSVQDKELENECESDDNLCSDAVEADGDDIVGDDEAICDSSLSDAQEEIADEVASGSDADTEDAIVEDVDGEDDITLDEAFIRNKSKDLHGAFSLNDMFRFRRELFGNNAAEMADAIELVSAMESYQEAEDYFYNDLGWDSDSEEVEEFMTIIRNHFR